MVIKCDYCKEIIEHEELQTFQGSGTMFDLKDKFQLCSNCVYFISDLIRAGRKVDKEE